MRVATSNFYNTASIRVNNLQSQLIDIENQISTGKKIVLPSDDPVGAAAASVAKDKLSNVNAFQTAVTTAQSRIDLSSSQIQSFVNVLQRVNELTVQARNPSYSPDELAMIGKEITQMGLELASSANAQDGQGNYLFGGTRNQTIPFALTSSGYQYQGDQTDAFVRTGANEISQTGWNGFKLFESAFSGDGSVDAFISNTNTGTSFVGEIREQGFGAYDGQPYEISFSLGGTGQIQVSVTNTTTAVVALGPIDYKKDMNLNFAGVDMVLKGDPKAGDTISVGASQRLNVLNVVHDLGKLLEAAPSKSKGELTAGLTTGMRSVERSLDSMLTNLALMGAESNSLSFRSDVLSSDELSLEIERSSYEALDYAKAITDLQKQQVALEASMQSFVKISGLNLFSFMR